MANPNPSPATRWQPGNRGAAADVTRLGTRNKLGKAFIEALGKKWETHGDTIVDQVASEHPEKLLEIVARLLPKEVAATLTVQQQTPQGLTQDEWHRLVELLRIPRDMGIEGTPDEIAERCEAAIRAEFSRPILIAPPPLE
jgi:hypothetical protein